MKYSLIVISYFLLLVCSCGNKQSKGIKSDDNLIEDTTRDSLVQEEQKTNEDSLAQEELKTNTVFPIKKSNHVGYYFTTGKPMYLKALDLRNGEVLSEIELPEECSSGDIFIDTVSQNLVFIGVSVCVLNIEMKQISISTGPRDWAYGTNMELRNDTLWLERVYRYDSQIDSVWNKTNQTSVGISLKARGWLRDQGYYEKFKLNRSFKSYQDESAFDRNEPGSIYVEMKYYLAGSEWNLYSSDTLVDLGENRQNLSVVPPEANPFSGLKVSKPFIRLTSEFFDDLCYRYQRIPRDTGEAPLWQLNNSGFELAVDCGLIACETWGVFGLYKKADEKWVELDSTAEFYLNREFFERGAFKVLNETECYICSKGWQGVYNTDIGEFVYQKEFDGLECPKTMKDF